MTNEIERELIDLRRLLLKLCGLTEQYLARAIESLRLRDEEMARSVCFADRQIDDLEMQVEESCLRILALRSPLAGDLRFVLSAIHTARDLERIGQLVRGLAERVVDLCDTSYFTIPQAIDDMAESTMRMVTESFHALADSNESLAVQIRRSDDVVDGQNRAVFSWAIEELQSSPHLTEAIVDVISIGRKLERIADHATNIAEDLIFAIGGRNVRHEPT